MFPARLVDILEMADPLYNEGNDRRLAATLHATAPPVPIREFGKTVALKQGHPRIHFHAARQTGEIERHQKFQGTEVQQDPPKKPVQVGVPVRLRKTWACCLRSDVDLQILANRIRVFGVALEDLDISVD